MTRSQLIEQLERIREHSTNAHVVSMGLFGVINQLKDPALAELTADLCAWADRKSFCGVRNQTRDRLLRAVARLA